MSFLLRIAPRASVGLVLGSLGLLVGCSGAKSQLVDEAPSDSATSSSTADAGATPSGDDDSNGSSGGSGSGSSSGGGGGEPVGTPAPASCPANGVTEDGSNGTRSSAMSFSDAACGTVSAYGNDWWKFVLPSSATKLAVEYSGHVMLQVTCEGDTTTLGPGSTLPFHPNAEYIVEVASATGQSEPYVILVEDQ